MRNDEANEITRVLRMLRRRVVARQFLSRAARGTLFFYAVLVLLSALAWWAGALVPDVRGIPFMLGWPFVAGALGAVVITLLKVPPLRAVALAMDTLGGTRDRLLSALDFATKPHSTELERMAASESVAWLRTRDLRPLLPVRPPGELRWLVLPLVTIALLWWSALGSIANRDAAVTAAQDEVRETLRNLEELAKQFDQHPADDEKMKEIAGRLRASAAQVRAEAVTGGEANKAALRELAKLEQLVKELRKPEFATPDELKALADALAQHERTREAAKDMADGNLADAAKKLEEAAQDPATAAQAEKNLQRALEHLSKKNEQLSKQLEKLQQGDTGGERQQLLRQIADALNQIQKQGGLALSKKQKDKGPQQQGKGRATTDEDLKKLLAALDRMKDRQQQQGEDGDAGEPQKGEGDAKAAVEMFSFQPGGKTDDDGPQSPTGQPGGEKDKGTTKDPFGKDSAPPATAGRTEQERGRLGEGESLSALIPSATAGDAKAQRRYKELTEAAAAAADDVVTQEEIPLGARHLIRRYFEAIRPK